VYKNKRILALIPARGGSKGLPGKNIKMLVGKPLIAWTIKQALSSKHVDKVMVSTEDNVIAKISAKYGAEVPFIRPRELAHDDSPTIDAILHALDNLQQRGQEFNYLGLLEPTSPLRKPGDIDNGIKKLIDNADKADSLVSVGEIALEHPSISKTINEQGYVEPFYDTKETATRRQNLSKAYFPYGVLYLSKVHALRKHKTFYQRRTLAYLIERWQNYEVDDGCDFICIEALLKSKLAEGSGYENR
jgi:CMP-N-acetylneuraminic acid synthetase